MINLVKFIDLIMAVIITILSYFPIKELLKGVGKKHPDLWIVLFMFLWLQVILYGSAYILWVYKFVPIP